VRGMVKKIIAIIGIISIIYCVGMGPVINGAGTITRIKDIARLQGVRNNQLTGMGLVVGLNGTGDNSKTNVQMVANVLYKMGYTLQMNDLRTKNVAAVIVTANLPPYLHNGDKLDVQVASLGDAKSLQGGILLQSPLSGADGKVYAVAQGTVYVGGYNVGGKRSSQQKNITTTGIVPMGALVEREVPVQLDHNGKLRWALNSPDFTTASRLADSINMNVARGVARAVDMGMVEVLIPREKLVDPIGFIAEIETLPVSPDGIAKVVINERTGTIVIGEQVKITKVAVTHGDVTVKVNSTQQISQLGPYGDMMVADQNQLQVNEEGGGLIELPEGTDIGTVVKALNSVGTNPRDIIAIIVAIKQAGALYGDLEIM
jgi:flagellar P-ring protein precursor FlgI